MLNTLTVKELRDYCVKEGIRPPSGLRKAELISYIEASQKEFADGAQAQSGAKCVSDITEIHPVYFNPEYHYIDHLVEYGWSIVPIPGWDEHNFVSDLFDFIEGASRDSGCSFDRNDRSTWLCKNMPMLLHGIFKQYVGHTEFCWKIRELCAGIFGEIYNVEPKDLLCSFDGANFSVPKKSHTLKQWFHVDQARDDVKGLRFIQGVANFLESGPDDGGLVLLEGSHLDYEGYLERHPTYGYSWCPIDMTDEVISQRRVIKVCAPPGHLILWDSMTVHCNMHPSSSNFRMCTYVSMQPREYATTKELKKGVELYEKGRMTGHARVGKWFSTNSENPRTYGGKLVRPTQVEIADLNELRMKLIGY